MNKDKYLRFYPRKSFPSEKVKHALQKQNQGLVTS